MFSVEMIATVNSAYRVVGPTALLLARQRRDMAAIVGGEIAKSGKRAIERATAHVRQALATADAVVARAQYQQEQPDAK